MYTESHVLLTPAMVSRFRITTVDYFHVICRPCLPFKLLLQVCRALERARAHLNCLQCIKLDLVRYTSKDKIYDM